MKQIFSKGSELALMITDFVKYIQEYYIPEDKKEYWDSLLKDCGELSKKYNDDKLLIQLMLGYIVYLEDKAKEEN